MEAEAAPPPAATSSVKPRRLAASGVRVRARNPRSRGGPSHFTPEEREQIKALLRELLTEDALPPKAQLARQLEVSQTTLNKYLSEVQQELDAPRVLN